MSAGDSTGGCDPVAATLASGVSEVCSSSVGVKWTPLLVGEASVSVPSQLEAGLVRSSSLGSVETFLADGDVRADAVSGRTELLGVPPVGEAGGLCGEKAVGGLLFAGRETGEKADSDALCSLSPVEEPVSTKVVNVRKPARRGRFTVFSRLSHFTLCLCNCEGDFKNTFFPLLLSPPLVTISRNQPEGSAGAISGSVNTSSASTQHELTLSSAC